ncbi:conserved Plasmodium protein, unknown function [Plasmodium malariae]|uniref:Uncharacterized protein n=1 Tax=Plasmodium malariae TaxID=5858 RepID=A0A1C3KZG8_PLAMA|nr:conserved Plasmodium protein, unknown function [Plasmodium malariae]
MKKIKLNITREEDNLQSNIYYVCERNILISQLNLTINFDENNVEDEEIIDEYHTITSTKDKTKISHNEEKKKQKYINIKISYSDELNNLYINNVINNIYDYIFENKVNNFIINKNHSWFIFINIYIYEYTPYIYEHICNVINVHLSLLLIPFCFYDFEYKWYRCIENYEELLKLLTSNNDVKQVENKLFKYDMYEATELGIPPKDGAKGKTIKGNVIQDDGLIGDRMNCEKASSNILILDKYEQNKNIIINQIENSNFDLFVQTRDNMSRGLFKRLLINFIPILIAINVNDEFVYVIKFIDYRDFFLNTQNKNDIMYNHIAVKYDFSNFMKCTLYDEMNKYMNDDDKKFELHENYYMLYNANNTTIDENDILMNSKPIIQHYYNFILNYCVNYFTSNFMQ